MVVAERPKICEKLLKMTMEERERFLKGFKSTITCQLDHGHKEEEHYWSNGLIVAKWR